MVSKHFKNYVKNSIRDIIGFQYKNLKSPAEKVDSCGSFYFILLER